MIIGVSDWRHFLAHKIIYIKIVEYGYDEPNSKKVEDSLQKAHKQVLKANRKKDNKPVSWQDMYGSQYYRKFVCFLVKIVVRFRIGF